MGLQNTALVVVPLCRGYSIAERGGIFLLKINIWPLECGGSVLAQIKLFIDAIDEARLRVSFIFYVLTNDHASIFEHVPTVVARIEVMVVRFI